jgi:antitoxin component YwqK of YwqJK toxin-antitoxin module
MKWASGGTTQSIALVVGGKIEGTFRRWHPDGRLAEEAEMVDGQLHGMSRIFDAQGRAYVEARLDRGKVLEHRAGRARSVVADPDSSDAGRE